MKLLTRYSTHIQKAILLSFLVLLSLIVVAQANPILKLPGRDNGTYLYIGSQILSGKLPYKDAWESKPPAIFYVNALGLWLGKGTRLGVWLMEFFAIFLATLISFILLQRLWKNQAALFGTLVWLYGLNRTLEGGNLTEEYSLPFSFLALLVFLYALEKPNLRFPDILIGTLFAINFLFRPNNTITQAAIALTLILLCFIQGNYRLLFFRLGALAIGALAVILIPVLYFWQEGALLEFYNATITFNITYSTTTIIANSNPLQSGFIILGASTWIAFAGFILSCAFLIRSIQTEKTTPPINLFLLVGYLAAIPLTDPASRAYSHYYMTWLPLIAMSSGYLYFIVQTQLFSRMRFFKDNEVRDNLVALFLTITMVITSGVGMNYFRALDRLSTHEGLKFGRRSAVARYVKNHTASDEMVYFWGGFPGENFMSQRDSPTPYLYYPLYLDSDLSDEINNAFLEDLMTQPPVLIIDMNYQRALSFVPDTRVAQLSSGVDFPYLPKNLYKVYDFIEENYYLESTIGSKKVYRLYGTN